MRCSGSTYRQGEHEFDLLAAEPTFRDFVYLYIAEGYKRRRHTVSICNSDPAMIELIDRWMSRLTDKLILLSIQYHADQDLQELREFWGALVGVDPNEIRAHDILFRARLEAWMDRLRSEWQ